MLRMLFSLEIGQMVEPAVLFAKSVEDVTLDALPDSPDLRYLHNLLIRFDVVVGRAINADN